MDAMEPRPEDDGSMLPAEEGELSPVSLSEVSSSPPALPARTFSSLSNSEVRSMFAP